jgi:hypothetical protein
MEKRRDSRSKKLICTHFVLGNSPVFFTSPGRVILPLLGDQRGLKQSSGKKSLLCEVLQLKNDRCEI